MNHGPYKPDIAGTVRPRFVPIGPPARRQAAPAGGRDPVAARRGAAVAVNYGPLTAYRSAHARLETATAQVDELQQQKDQLQAELGKLGEAGYLESLARGQLTYAKPGEEVYIVPAEDEAASTETTESSAETTGEKPGLLERILSAIGDIF